MNSRRKFLRLSAPGRRAGARRHRPGGGAGLSQPAGALDPGVCSGRSHRHRGAAGRPIPVREARPAIRHREPARRRRQSCDPGGRERGCRRPHDLAIAHARDQCDALSEADVQFHPRHRADGGDSADAEHARSAPVGAGEDGAGVHRLRQGQCGQAQLRLVGQRHLGASCGRTVQGDDGHPSSTFLIAVRDPP